MVHESDSQRNKLGWSFEANGTDWIKSLSADARREVEMALQRRSYADGQAIYCAGQRDGWSYRVVSGTVHIREIDSTGREFLIVGYGPGNCFGVMQVIDGGPYPQDAVAHGAVTLDCLSEGSLDRLRTRWPEIDRALAVWAVRRLRELMGVLRDSVFLDLRRQLAGRIDLLLEFVDDQGASGQALRLQLTHEMLAASVGATRQAISAVLKDWAQAGIVHYHYGQFTVLNREALRAEARRA